MAETNPKRTHAISQAEKDAIARSTDALFEAQSPPGLFEWLLFVGMFCLIIAIVVWP